MKKLGVFIPFLLTIVLAFSIIPSAFAGTWLIYDDGTRNSSPSTYSNTYWMVKFSLPAGWASARLITTSLYIFVANGDVDLECYILGKDGKTPLMTPFIVTIPSDADNSFHYIDLGEKNIIVEDEFWIAFKWMESLNPLIGADGNDPIDGRSYSSSSSGFDTKFEHGKDLMIRAEVDPIGHPVGGVFYSADKVGLLLPYIALVGLIGTISTIFAIKRWRKD